MVGILKMGQPGKFTVLIECQIPEFTVTSGTILTVRGLPNLKTDAFKYWLSKTHLADRSERRSTVKGIYLY